MMRTVWSPRLIPPPEVDELFISLRKPAEVMRAAGIADYVCAVPATLAHLVRAHDYNYAAGVLNLTVPNGFGDCRAHVRDHVLAANGVMVRAVQMALDNPLDCVFAPVSGFHHARYASAEGYCTFNGLLVALAAARVERRVPNVLIIDGDAHYGDGTDDILARLNVGGVVNLTHRESGPNRLSPKVWEAQIRGLLTNRHWDLVMYQAGADAHKDDPYGVGYLSDEEWEHRDYSVFHTCRAMSLPLVFNLAGGYNGDKTIELHTRTVKAARISYRSSHLMGEVTAPP